MPGFDKGMINETNNVETICDDAGVRKMMFGDGSIMLRKIHTDHLDSFSTFNFAQVRGSYPTRSRFIH